MTKRYSLIYSETDGRYHILDRELKQLLLCVGMREKSERKDLIYLWYNKDTQERFINKSEIDGIYEDDDERYRIESYTDLNSIEWIEEALNHAYSYM